MRIAITGATGQLGSELTKSLAGHELLAGGHQESDVTDYKRLFDVMGRFQPELVIHTAAFTNVDGCEEDADKAYLVNAVGTQNVALACRELDAAMFYVSTDFVFDGAKGSAYHEYDDVHPLSVYGRSKLAGEQIVRSILSKHYVARTAWVFGKQGHNFIKTILRLADEKNRLRIVNDQFGSPTYAADLAAKIAELSVSREFGTYHVVNEGSCSWYDLTREALILAGREDIIVEPMSSVELSRPATRPAYSVLDAMALRLRGFAPMRHYSEGLRDFFKHG